MYHAVQEHGEELTTSLSRVIEDQPIIDVKAYSMRYAIDVICKCLFGVNSNAIRNNGNCEFVEKAREIFENRTRRHLIALLPSRMKKFLRLKVFDPKVSKFFDETIREIMESRRHAENANNKDFLQILMTLIEATQEGRSGEGKMNCALHLRLKLLCFPFCRTILFVSSITFGVNDRAGVHLF